jgi:hypothetical protein
MLDEVWLRARRQLVHELVRANIWPEVDAYTTYMRGQAEVGQRLEKELLRVRLPARDAVELGSEAIFGAANTRFRRRLPLVLAFGYTFGFQLVRLIGGRDAKADRIGRLTAVFNFGISVFDLVCDGDPQVADELHAAFDATALEAISVDRRQVEVLRRRADNVETSEIRLLLRLISMFFADLASMACQTSRADGDQDRLRDLLAQAYSAEAGTLRRQAQASRKKSLAAAQLSSQLPFTIIAALAHLTSAGTASKRALVDDFLGHAGVLFALTDDLLDLVVDLQSGALNSILIRNGILGGAADYERDYVAITNLLEGRELQRSAHEARTEAERALTVLKSPDVSRTADANLRRALICYLRSWIE